MALNRCKNGHMFSEKKHGKICPYCNIALGPDQKATGEDPLGQYSEIYLDELENKQRVVGWLVCVSGPSKGKDYRILPEKNFVGRSPDMDIRILGDNNINSRNHAIIMYDPEKNHTVVLPGDSQGLVYKLDNEDSWEVVYEPKELLAGDRLKIGNSEFIFVAFCGDNEGFKFNWRDFEND